MEHRTKRILVVAVLAVAGLAVVSANAVAPAVDSARIKPRIFNDDADSILTTNNSYPALISIKDEKVDGDSTGGSFANRHNFRLSEDGGASDAVFLNDHQFSIAADITLTGTANLEGGLNLAPWWSKDVDGVFMLNGATGEIACFGGRLPFYSFTANHAVTYTKGTTVRCSISYDPNGLSMADPATIEYTLFDGVNTYSSGLLAFNEGNPAEDPPYGLWGILNDARLGGYVQIPQQTDNPDNWGMIEFANIEYVPEPAALSLLALGGLAMLRRRR